MSFIPTLPYKQTITTLYCLKHYILFTQCTRIFDQLNETKGRLVNQTCHVLRKVMDLFYIDISLVHFCSLFRVIVMFQIFFKNSIDQNL